MKSSTRAELVRWLVLALVAYWLFSPFAARSLIGAGDAQWYAQMLADFVTQWRDGAFPVFVGQTEYAFNGAVYPLRVAPAYQHLAGIVDLVTGNQLGFYALQNTVLLLCGAAALGSAYLCTRALAPGAGWSALGLAILFVTCPGVWGLVATQDQLMSWVAMPAISLACFGAIRAWERNDRWAWAATAIGVSWLWLAHAPLAFCTTLFVGASHAARLLTRHRTQPAWTRAVLAGAAVVVLAHYPFLSLHLLEAGTSAATSGAFSRPEVIIASLREAFPQALLPLTPRAAQLGDLQLGYGLWGILLLTLAIASWLRHYAIAAATTVALALLLLLFPWPGLSEAFWLNLPDAVLRLTYYWPMQRLIPIAAGIIVTAAAALLPHLVRSHPQATRAFASVIALSCGWSLRETVQMRAAIGARTSAPEASTHRLRPENLVLMNHAYGLYPALPPTFSHGVMDPAAELRLLDPKTRQPLAVAPGEVEVAGTFVGVVDANPGILNLEPRLTLEPGRRYELRFVFRDHDYTGILQLVGAGVFREYRLPESGESRAFGTTPGASNALPLWTTQGEPTQVQLRFIPTAPGTNPMDFTPFAHFELYELPVVSADRAAMTSSRPSVDTHLQLRSLMPLAIDVQTPEAALLETPRMYLPHYRATVDGIDAPVERSASGLTAVAVPPGDSRVELEYRAPLLLHASYWLTLVAWSLVLVAILPLVLRRRAAIAGAHARAS